MEISNQRLHLLDALRGLTVLSMIAYHALWSMVNLYGYDLPFFGGTGSYIWQQSICCTFILLSGFSLNLSRRPIRRGLTVFLAGALVSAATLLFVPQAAIIFGVPTLIGSSMLIFSLLFRRGMAAGSADSASAQSGISEVRAGTAKSIGGLAGGTAACLLCLAAFLLTKSVPDGFIGNDFVSIAELPSALYRDYFTAFIGFPPADFFTADYFPLIPWLFLFGCGFFSFKGITSCLGGFLRRGSSLKALTFIGRHSLIIYLLHQPAIVLVLELIKLLRKA